MLDSRNYISRHFIDFGGRQKIGYNSGRKSSFQAAGGTVPSRVSPVPDLEVLGRRFHAQKSVRTDDDGKRIKSLSFAVRLAPTIWRKKICLIGRELLGLVLT